MPCLCQLGKSGDVIQLLPAARYWAAQEGRPVDWIIDGHYAPILDGVSYAEARVFDTGSFRNVNEARRWAARMGYRNPLVTQGGGHNWRQPRISDSYALDARIRCGVPDEVWQHPVVFDQRDPEREARLVAEHRKTDRPLVLVAPQGESSPFVGSNHLTQEVRTVVPNAEVIDLRTVKGERVYDLLALYDRAACLVTVDTCHLHLAAACPRLPVVALISDRGALWAGTIPLPAVNLIIQCRYGEWEARKYAMLWAVSELVGYPWGSSFYRQ